MDRTKIECTYIGKLGKCLTQLTPRQLNYSQRKYGRPVCYIHQRMIDLKKMAIDKQE